MALDLCIFLLCCLPGQFLIVACCAFKENQKGNAENCRAYDAVGDDATITKVNFYSSHNTHIITFLRCLTTFTNEKNIYSS